VITLHENGISSIRASKKPIREGFHCNRCGTTNRRGTAEGCPWCADCRAVIAIDPDYLTANYPPDAAQALFDRWINTRRGAKRRTLATAV
jgi:hypothetical protein